MLIREGTEEDYYTVEQMIALQLVMSIEELELEQDMQKIIK